MTSLISIHDLNIYAVEPSKVQAQFLEARLEMLGVKRLKVFRDGASILAALRENTPDVVVSSLYLPDMTGGELVARMRAQDWGKLVAFILISSESNPRYLEPVRQSGSSAILRKPYRVEQLKQALIAALDYLSPSEEYSDLGEEIDLDVFKVLLVDDSAVARRFIRQILENLGMSNFVEAENGKEAAALIQEQRFDLVVTDYNMPEMDGKELTEFIRTRSHQNALPVLMVSSERNEKRLAAIEQAGVSGVCDKPFEPQIVRNLLEKMLLGR